MLSLGQVIQLHISPFELLTEEEGDKMHQFYELNLPPHYYLTPHSCVEKVFSVLPGAKNRHLKDLGFKAQSNIGSLRKAPNPENLKGLKFTTFLDGSSYVLISNTCPPLVYSYPGTHSAFVCYCEESSYSQLSRRNTLSLSHVSLEEFFSILASLLSF